MQGSHHTHGPSRRQSGLSDEVPADVKPLPSCTPNTPCDECSPRVMTMEEVNRLFDEMVRENEAPKSTPPSFPDFQDGSTW